MCEISSNRGKRGLEIFEDLPGLSAKVIHPNDLSRSVKGDLTGDKDSSPTGHLHDLCKPRRFRQSRWINEARVCWLIFHCFLFLNRYCYS